MQQTKVKKVVAGPGSGKTYGLIKEVLDVLPSVRPNKYLAVITYTNAASEKIKSDLEKEIRIPHNLFIGTIHSFLDRFILIPHASKLGIVPNDLTFIDEIKVDDNRYKKLATKKARDKGVISYEQIEWISEKIVCGGKIKTISNEVNLTKKIAYTHAQIISRRLQYIFVDEYQDATISQHNIFTSLIKTNLIEYFYCVGDPEQYIYGFTYKGRPNKPNYLEIPIHKMETQTGINSVQSNMNYRSQPKIVSFLNNFTNLKQINNRRQLPNQPDVYFIDNLNQEEIINIFLSLCLHFKLDKDRKFFLSYAANTINFSEFTGINEFLDPALKPERILSETIKYITGLIGMSQKEICKNKNWSVIDLRKVGLKVLFKIRIGEINTEDQVSTFLLDNFQLYRVNNRYYERSNKISFTKILSAIMGSNENPLNIYSTIHKSKGLEAHAVLVLAKTKQELIKWIETNNQSRSLDENDTCRVGFVAFSRARDLLCIACLQNTKDVKSDIQNLGVKYELPL